MQCFHHDLATRLSVPNVDLTLLAVYNGLLFRFLPDAGGLDKWFACCSNC